jgi:aryl carrier-like protein
LLKYPNAFSIAVPAIKEVGYFSRITQDAVRRKLAGFSYTPEGSQLIQTLYPYMTKFFLVFCSFLEDGLLKLSQGARCGRYILDMPWDVVEREMGHVTSASHLFYFDYQDSKDSNKTQDRSTVIDTVLSLLDVSPSDFSPDVPFVAYGLDSLGATRIAEAIKPYATVSQMQLLGGLTWKQLEAAIMAEESGAPLEHTRSMSTEPLLQLVEKYGKDFGVHRPSKPAEAGEVVLITGTTGALGASVLSELVQSSAIRLVYALNRRPADGSSFTDQQKDALITRGLDASILNSSKVIFIEAALDLPDLGLTLGLIERVCDLDYVVAS